jgi:hypothetical protein
MGFIALSTNCSSHILYHCFFFSCKIQMLNTHVCAWSLTSTNTTHTLSLWTLGRLVLKSMRSSLSIVLDNTAYLHLTGWQAFFPSKNRRGNLLLFYMVVHLTRNSNQHGKIKVRHWNGRFHFVCVLLTQVWQFSVLTVKHIMRWRKQRFLLFERAITTLLEWAR